MFAETTEPDSLYLPLNAALETASLDWSDFSLPLPAHAPDRFRLPLADVVLDRPWTLEPALRRLAGDDADVVGMLERAIGELATLTGIDDPAPTVSTSVFDARDEIAGAFPGAPIGQRRLIEAVYEAAWWLHRDWPPIAPDILDRAREHAVADEETAAEEATPFELRAAEHEAHLEAERFFASAESLDIARRMVAAKEAIAAWSAPWGRAEPDDAWVGGRVTTVLGDIVFGTHGNDSHTGAALLVVDPGGDDHYELTDAWAVFDAAGDDEYRAPEGGAVAAGVGRVSAVFDRGGNDTYHGGDIGLGAGILGVGVLVDDDGDDLYLGRRFGQGAGFFGVGILLDRNGHDTYRMAAYGQGYGYVGGVGILRDVAGGDRYLFSPEITDIIRYDDHYVSFLQGAALGHRPTQSGGIGLLVDDAGNDLYDSDIFGQGTAYWYGLAGLIDRDGHDVYAGYQYAQGAGVHLAAAVLHDDAGDDLYRARGVCQGVGHDLAFGALVDRAGNDTYITHDLGQGAGNANGIGVLIDHSGRDTYLQAESNTLGYGNSRRGSGSVGLFVDVRGDDQYTHRGADGSVFASGRVGRGVDHPEPMEAADVWPGAERVPVESRDYTIDELFVLASTAPPKFADWKTYALDELEKRGAGVMPEIVRHLGSPLVRERYGVRDIAVRVGPEAVPPLGRVLESGPEDAARDAVWCLGYIGAVEAVAVLEPHLADQSDPDMLTAVAMAIGRTARSNERAREMVSSDALLTLLDSDSRNVRRAVLVALGSLERASLADTIAASLADPFVGVRISAADQLVRLGLSAIPTLAAHLADTGVARRGALGALARIDDDAARVALSETVPSAAAWSVPDRLALVEALAGHAARRDPDDKPHPNVTDALQGFAHDPDWRVSSVASASR